jgi:hypothetical protein
MSTKFNLTRIKTKVVDNLERMMDEVEG